MTPYPDGEGPLFGCERRHDAGNPCDWTGYPNIADVCGAHPDGGPHRFEPLNFDPFSFEPLWTYAANCGHWLRPSEFMAMGSRPRVIEGAPVVIFAYKHVTTRNYLHIDDHGLSAWTNVNPPEPLATHFAVEHATCPGHRHDDGCLSRTSVATPVDTDRRRSVAVDGKQDGH